MSKPFLLRKEFIAITLAMLPVPYAVFGTDPVVRQYLRNIDDDPKIDATSEGSSRIDVGSLFESPTFTPPSEFRGAETRRWRDNTGAYEVEGRLIIIYPDKVRLQKANGRTTTVAMRRLSQFDQSYVRWVAEHMIRTGSGSGSADGN